MRRQDLWVLALYYSGFTKLRNPILRRRGGPLVRFVTYHDIPSDDAENFSAMLHHLQRTANVVSMDDYFSGKLSDKKTNVVITFDDGFRNWTTIAAPMLRRLDLPATFFISSGLVRPSDLGRLEFVKPSRESAGDTHDFLTETDVRQIARDGFTIGGHTVNHVNLGAFVDKTELAREITADRQRLASITGKKVQYFAYPFGVYRNASVDLVALLKDAGYRGAVTTVSGFNSAASNAYLLHRELTGVPMSLPVFAARVDGAYDGVKLLKGKLSALLGNEAVGK